MTRPFLDLTFSAQLRSSPDRDGWVFPPASCVAYLPGMSPDGNMLQPLLVLYNTDDSLASCCFDFLSLMLLWWWHTIGNAVFPNAMIAGDVVITDLLARMGYLKDGQAKIMVVDTFHLFPETMEFLKVLEGKYGFTADIFCADGIPIGDKAAFDKQYGADLWKEDIDEYDRVCKVEPFQRGLKTLKTDCMINGRTRWQGAERAWIDLFENAPIGGGMAKCNPLAYWTLEDTFDYITKYQVPYHPLHEKGYPSIGDA